MLWKDVREPRDGDIPNVAKNFKPDIRPMESIIGCQI